MKYQKKNIGEIGSIGEAVDFFRAMVNENPQRDALQARLAAMEGRRRKYPCFYLGYQFRPEDKTVGDDELFFPEIMMSNGPGRDLACEIMNLLLPLKLLNPVAACLRLGKGTGTLAASFGIPLDPSLGDQPAYTLTLDEILDMPEINVAEAGLMPEMRRKIEFIKENIRPGSGLYIAEPDMQGPFNIAHAIAGENILIAPYVEPEKFHETMKKVTNVWIETLKLIRRWIGDEWRDPVQRRVVRIAECSVNLVSRQTYEDFILPYDLEIARAFSQPLLIHTCSGAHVFHATLERLPDVLFTEAGYIKNAVRGWTPVDEAVEAIGDRPVVLQIGQEIYEKDDPEALIKKDLDRYEKNPRLLFNYTHMDWRNQDRPKLREIHRRCDEYWTKRFEGLAESC